MGRDRKLIPTIIAAAIFIALEIAALNMLRSNSSLQSIWISRGAHRVMSVLWGGSESIKYYFSLKKHNEALALENFRLKEELSAFQGEKKYPEVIIDTKKGFVYAPAEVIKVSRNKQHNYMIIDKGSEDGIKPRSGIITMNGVVGIIDAVEKHMSYALTFMNSDVSISARLGGEGAVGPLIWDGRTTSGAILKEIPLLHKYEKGDTVYTSGFSSIFPPDIPLGVAGDSKIINGATNEIKVTLFQDFTALRFVTVVYNSQIEEVEALEK